MFISQIIFRIVFESFFVVTKFIHDSISKFVSINYFNHLLNQIVFNRIN